MLPANKKANNLFNTAIRTFWTSTIKKKDTYEPFLKKTISSYYFLSEDDILIHCFDMDGITDQYGIAYSKLNSHQWTEQCIKKYNNVQTSI